MQSDEPKYYEDIEILVDGWPWNVRDTDFRKRGAVGRGSRMLEARRILDEKKVAALFVAVSGNRRVRERRARERRST